MSRRKWDISQLRKAVANAKSYRQVLRALKLKEAGGNYAQVKKYITEYSLNTTHFKGQAWNKGLKIKGIPRVALRDILQSNSTFQSYKLKKRLFLAGIKTKQCEVCGWAEKTEDGRLPLELNHINGDSSDNRLKNLEILCPNCHSLRPHYRGGNRKK